MTNLINADKSYAEKIKFECSLCCELYDENKRKPLVLVPCGHSLCKVCAHQLVVNECPFCRIEISKTLKFMFIQPRFLYNSFSYDFLTPP